MSAVVGICACRPELHKLGLHGDDLRYRQEVSGRSRVVHRGEGQTGGPELCPQDCVYPESCDLRRRGIFGHNEGHGWGGASGAELSSYAEQFSSQQVISLAKHSGELHS